LSAEVAGAPGLSEPAPYGFVAHAASRTAATPAQIDFTPLPKVRAICWKECLLIVLEKQHFKTKPSTLNCYFSSICD
jgi:hypothetical protein